MGESGLPALLQKEERESAKSGVPKVLFPDIGKITNRIEQIQVFSETFHWTLYHKRHDHNLKWGLPKVLYIVERECRGKMYWNFWSKSIILLTLDNTVLLCSLKISFDSNISPRCLFNGRRLIRTFFFRSKGWWVSLLLRPKTTVWAGFL